MPDVNNPHTQNIIVSAFMNNVNQREDRKMDKYIEYGKTLLATNLPKVVFIEREIYSKYWRQGEIGGTFHIVRLGAEGALDINECEIVWDETQQTLFVFFEKNQMYLYRHIDKIVKFSLETSNPRKDTVEYMFTQCYKTEWMRLAINIVEKLGETRILGGNFAMSAFPPNNQYIWMDFGIFHMFGGDEAEFSKQIAELDTRVNARFAVACSNGHTFKTVYFASCWNHTYYYHLDIYSQIHWVFAGSVFGGYRDALMMFADNMKDECLRTINEKKHLMWEVNVWYLIYKKYPHYFDFYTCDHNPSIISNY